jgi:hypothetical protein
MIRMLVPDSGGTNWNLRQARRSERSGGAGTAPPQEGAAPPRGGHHYVPRKVFENKQLNLSTEAQKVFDRGRTGPLQGQVHRGGKDHDEYNRAVREHMLRYLRDNGIRPEAMTAEQANKFLDEVKRSRDPRIRDFNLRIFRREFLFQLRRGPRID